MTKTLTITLSDEQYAALQATAAREQQSPEEVATAAVAGRLQAPATQTPAPNPQTPLDPALALMQARGELVDPATLPPYPGADDIPPRGTPERERLEEELGNALSDALERSGLSILDLIERR